MNIKDSMCLNVKEEDESLLDIQNVNVFEVRLENYGYIDILYYGFFNCVISCEYY